MSRPSSIIRPLSGLSNPASVTFYVKALGLGLSAVFDSIERASSILTRLLQFMNVAAFFSGASLKFIPTGTDAITANSAIAGRPGSAGLAGSATPGAGGLGSPSGVSGARTPGHSGATGSATPSEGGGIAILGIAVGDNTTVTGNQASKFPNIDGTLST